MCKVQTNNFYLVTPERDCTQNRPLYTNIPAETAHSLLIFLLPAVKPSQPTAKL